MNGVLILLPVACVSARGLPAGALAKEQAGRRCGVQRRHDPIDIVDTPGPGAAARPLQRGPEAAVVRQPLVGREPRIRWPAAEQRAARLRVERHALRAHQVDGAGQRVPIDHDLDEIAISNASDGPFVQRLGPDVTDAGSAREPGEPAVGDERDVFAPGQVAERRGDLRGLLHAGPRRPHTNQDDDVAFAYPVLWTFP